LINNLALLIFFKYARFFIENLNAVFAWVHLPARLPDPTALMPLGAEYILPVGSRSSPFSRSAIRLISTGGSFIANETSSGSRPSFRSFRN